MNIEQLDWCFSAVSRKYPVKPFAVMGILSIATLEYRFRETVFADDPERERVREAIGREVANRTTAPGPGDFAK